MLFIHQYPDWTNFRYSRKAIIESLCRIRFLQGNLQGKISFARDPAFLESIRERDLKLFSKFHIGKKFRNRLRRSSKLFASDERKASAFSPCGNRRKRRPLPRNDRFSKKRSSQGLPRRSLGTDFARNDKVFRLFQQIPNRRHSQGVHRALLVPLYRSVSDGKRNPFETSLRHADFTKRKFLAAILFHQRGNL